MSAYSRPRRISSEHIQPLIGGTIRRARQMRYDLPASIVTQMMAERQRSAGVAVLAGPPRNPAVEAYRRGSEATVRRMPSGFGHTDTV